MGKGAYLGGDGDGRVDGVGDDAEHGLGARLGARSDEVAHDRAVGVEEIVTGHSGLAGHSCGDDNDITALKGVVGLIHTDVSGDLGREAHVGDVGSDSRSANNIEHVELSDIGVELQEKGQRLTDSASSTGHGNLVVALGHGGRHAGNRSSSKHDKC